MYGSKPLPEASKLVVGGPTAGDSFTDSAAVALPLQNKLTVSSSAQQSVSLDVGGIARKERMLLIQRLLLAYCESAPIDFARVSVGWIDLHKRPVFHARITVESNLDPIASGGVASRLVVGSALRGDERSPNCTRMSHIMSVKWVTS